MKVSFPPVVVIDDNTGDPVEMLLGALGPENTNREQRIEVCVDIDLTSHKEEIKIGDNRSLVASESCKRSARALGPRIRVRDKRGRKGLFVVTGDNVLISGFRLEGPTDYIGQGDRHEKGIIVSPPATDFDGNALPPIRNVEISNMEIFHWSGVGVQVQDNVPEKDRDPRGRGRLFNTNPAGVRVKGNYFHHNRHGAGEGYGVNSTAGAYVTIEQNVFDENRHAIAGGSKHKDAEDYSGYTARDNLILAGGGVHCRDSKGTSALWGAVIGGFIGGAIGAAIGAGIGAIVGSVCWQTHQIDMHGTKGDWLLGEKCCGTAGETIIIERNTILYTKGWAIKIRGNPADKAVVDGNVFKHKREDAIDQNGDPGFLGFGDNISNPIDVRPNNVFDCGDLTTELGQGDFAGDGQLDDFMATGVTWWARSPTTGQWRYLNTMNERLPELQLSNIDGDAICDVAPRTRHPGTPPEKYSKSGTSPWLQNVIHPY
jgi:hypothetical protein